MFLKRLARAICDELEASLMAYSIAMAALGMRVCFNLEYVIGKCKILADDSAYAFVTAYISPPIPSVRPRTISPTTTSTATKGLADTHIRADNVQFLDWVKQFNNGKC